MTRWILLLALLPCILAADLMIRRFDVEITDTTAKLTWVHDLGHHDSGLTYEIEHMSSDSPDVQTATTRLKHFEFHRLAPNQKHRFRVRAVITSNSRVPKQEGDFTQWIALDIRGGSSMGGGGSRSLPPLPLPTYGVQPISNLRVLRQLGNGRSIELTWDRAQGGPEIMYSIEHVRPNGDSRLFRTNSNHRTFANLQLGRHRFRVSSTRSTAAQPDWSGVLTVDVSQSGAVGGVGVVGPALPAPVVANLRVDRQFRNGRSIELTWELPSGAATGVIYNVEHSPPNGRVKLTRTNMNRLVLDSLELGRHRFRVATTIQQPGQRVSDAEFLRGVWSQALTVDINQGGSIGGSGVVGTPRNGHGSHVGTITSGGGTLRAPSNFQAAVLSPTSLLLDWQYDGGISPPGIYFVVTMRMPSTGAVQTYQITDTRFTLSNLSPGEEYRLSVKSARSPADQSGSSRTVYQRMPTWTNFFAVGELRVSTRTGGPNAANISWSVPRDKVHLIKGYTVRYSEDESDSWQTQYFPGNKGYAQVAGLKPDTSYKIMVKTHLSDGMVTTSSEYMVKMPPSEPVQKLDIIYTSTTNEVKLKWLLDPTVVTAASGYEILLSKDENAPPHRWQLQRSRSALPEFTLQNLDPASTYYVKLNVLKLDGRKLEGRITYRFNTLEQHRVQVNQPMPLTYSKQNRGTYQFTWVYPPELISQIQGATVMYTDDNRKPETEWMKYLVSGSRTNTLTLTALQPGKMYYIRVMPRGRDGRYLETLGQTVYQVNTGIPSGTRTHSGSVVISGVADRPQLAGSIGGGTREDLPLDNTDQLCLRPCRPQTERTLRSCAAGERCVAAYRNALNGWCMTQQLIDSATRNF